MGGTIAYEWGHHSMKIICDLLEDETILKVTGMLQEMGKEHKANRLLIDY